MANRCEDLCTEHEREAFKSKITKNIEDANLILNSKVFKEESEESLDENRF